MMKRNRANVRSTGGPFRITTRALARVAVAAAVVLLTATPVRADGALTAAVAGSYFPRTEDAGLHSIAHQRVAEISACATCMNHSLMRGGTAEVIAFNFGSADPIGGAVAGWRGSATHNAILSNTSYGRIGCAQTTVGVTSYFVCVLAPGPLPAGAPAVAAAPAPVAGPAGGGGVQAAGGGLPAGGVPAGALPDTATPRSAHGGGAWHMLA
jgi:hypothetical protein